ncbi:hypothetical protein MASR1M32_17470 [Rhodobacter sp.]
MSLIATRALSLTLGQPLFAGLSFTLHPGDRLGLVAANGRGKSSLLALLAGSAEPTGGEITRARGLTLAHVTRGGARAPSAPDAGRGGRRGRAGRRLACRRRAGCA